MQPLNVLNAISFVLGTAFHLVNILLSFVLATKLVGVGLGHAYWSVVALLLFHSVESYLSFGAKLPRELLIFEIGSCFNWILTLLLIWQLSRAVFAAYPSIGGFVRRIALYVVIAALLLGFVSFLANPAPPGRPRILLLWVALNQGASVASLLVLLFLGGIAGWFPIRMQRNVARLLIGFMVICAAGGVSGYLYPLYPKAVYAINGMESMVRAIVVTYWLVTLGRAGQEDVMSPVAAWSLPRLAHTTRQLNEIQARLAQQGSNT